ncbi:methylmalonyl-CoA mutase family protein, partial [Seonamhaeicola marinus]
QAKIDAVQDIIVGVNKYTLEEEAPISTLEVDNQTVRNQQIEGLKKLKAARNTEKVKQTLLKLTEAAKTGKENLLVLAIEAARERATLGEISDALETVFGRYKAQIKSFSGVYSKEVKNNESFKKAQELADAFAEQDG